MQLSEQKQRIKYVVTDWVMSFIAFLGFNCFRCEFLDLDAPQDSLSYFLLEGKIVAEQLIIPLVMLLVYWLSGFYNNPYFKSRLQEFFTTLFSALLCTAVIFLAILTNDMINLSTANYILISVLFGSIFVCLYAGRILITNHTIKQLKKSGFAIPVVIYGASNNAKKTAKHLSDSKGVVAYDVKGYVQIADEECEVECPDLITNEELDEMCRTKRVAQVILAPAENDDIKMLHLLNRLFSLRVPVKIAPDTLSYVTSGIRLQDIYGQPFVDLTTSKMSESSKNVKRMIDILVSGLALILLALPFLAIALMVKRSSKGSVFYSQERIGYRQRPFMIYKFRSMYTDSEKDGPQLSSDGDSRVTPFGRIMRKYRIDELPQFWNVLKGDMSLVGPRPEREYYIEQIKRQAPWYTLVHQVRPGITSWGMVKYGYAETVDEMVERARFDLVYLSNMSNTVDMKIMIYTVRTIIKGQGQ